MTITLLAPDGVAVTAQQERQANAAVYGGGAGRPLGGRSGFRVDTPSNILAATATTWTLGPCSAMIDPGASTHQGMYGWASDANITGSVTAADSTNARKDIVYIQVNDSSAGDGSGAKTANVSYLAGVASTTPVAPTLPARSFLVGTLDVPKAGGGAPVVTLNPARFVAAGSPLPVIQATRDALTPYDGFMVERMDVKGRPTETWDASLGLWVGTAAPAAGAGWALTGSLARRGTQVSAAFMCNYSGGAFSVTSAFIKTLTLANPGYIPGADVFGYVTFLTASNVVIGDGSFNINPSGEIYVRTFSGSVSIAPPGTNGAANKFYISANWNA